MSLPAPKKKAAASTVSMLDRNRQQEAVAEQAEGMRLPPVQDEAVGRLSVAPIPQSRLDVFEDQYTALKRQRRTLKRYEVVRALLEAFAEEPVVQAAVIKYLK